MVLMSRERISIGLWCILLRSEDVDDKLAEGMVPLIITRGWKLI